MNFAAMLKAKAAMTPATGFNLVGLDDFEDDPEDQLYLVGSYDSRAEAEDAMKTRKKKDPDETLYIYGSDEAKKGGDAIDALDALAKGLPPGKGNNVNDNPGKPTAKFGVGPSKPGGAPGNAGQGGDKPEPPAKPGEGAPGATAQAADPDKGSVQYPTKVKDPQSGEFTFVYLDDNERPEDAVFVVSDETGEGAHWERPQDSDDYAAFKQWKAARKKGLEGDQIPQELVQGAMRHAEKHHFDGGPHKAAYDDHLAHQGGDKAPAPPPSHHSVKQPGQSHPAMQGAQDKGKDKDPKGDPPKPKGKTDKDDFIGKLIEFAQQHVSQDDETEKTLDYGASRSGTERPATSSMAGEVDGYQALYGAYGKSGDAIDGLEVLAKAGPHKYKSRKPDGKGGWIYDYGTGGSKPKSGGQIISKKVTATQLKEGDIIQSPGGPAEVQSASKMGDKMSVSYRYLDSGDYHERYFDAGGQITVHLEHPAIGVYNKRQQEAQKSMGSFRDGGYDSLRKGLYAFDLSRSGSNYQAVPDRLLYDYLCSFIEEAWEHEKREPEHNKPMAGEDFYQTTAMPVMHELVQYVTKNPNLKRAVDKFNVTLEVIVEIMKKRGMMVPPSDAHRSHGDYWSHDWDSMTAMGINDRNGPTGEVLMASDARMDLHAEPDAVRPLQLRKSNEVTPFEHRDHDVTGLVRRASHGQIHARYVDDPILKANYNAGCLLHGDIHKQQIGHGATLAKCTCPR